MPTREEAVRTLEDWVENPALRGHMYAVEAAVRSYATRFGEDADAWGLAGLLHDLDWEKYPDDHPNRAVDHLRSEGYSEEILQAILAHRSDFTGVEPGSRLDRTLIACDELTGLINATALVRPTGIDDLKPKSVRKKMKDATFARGVDRDDIRRGADLLGVDLDTHIQNVIDAMRTIAGDLGITGARIGGND
ncbi:MAG TPA: HD domain-containing protein [Longimicrobiales bacterium]|nr:HD domain-containing protein [Longimicrobiales bacterium]